MASSDDQRFMLLALEQARQAYDAGEMPIGAVVVCNGEVFGIGNNREHRDLDPTAHVEVVAIRQACHDLKTLKLKNSTLYTTIYPCPMCEASAIEAGITHIVYGGETFKYFREVRHKSDSLKITGSLHAECRDLFEKRLREKGKDHVLDYEDI